MSVVSEVGNGDLLPITSGQASGLVPVYSPSGRRRELRPQQGRRGRRCGIFPPYSPHSQWAGLCLVLFTWGVVMAVRLPGALPPTAQLALRAFAALEIVWALLLLWLLLFDPRAKPPPVSPGGMCVHGSVSPNPDGTSMSKYRCCPHGCVVETCLKTRHCRHCDKCVAGFDHHCLWLNTCVGSRNYRTWVAFVTCLWAWTVIGASIAWTLVWRAWPVHSRRLAVGHRPVALLTALGMAATACWLMMLLVLQAYFAVNNLTTLEFIKGEKVPRFRSRSFQIPLEYAHSLLTGRPRQRQASAPTPSISAAMAELMMEEGELPLRPPEAMGGLAHRRNRSMNDMVNLLSDMELKQIDEEPPVPPPAVPSPSRARRFPGLLDGADQSKQERSRSKIASGSRQLSIKILSAAGGMDVSPMAYDHRSECGEDDEMEEHWLLHTPETTPLTRYPPPQEQARPPPEPEQEDHWLFHVIEDEPDDDKHERQRSTSVSGEEDVNDIHWRGGCHDDQDLDSHWLAAAATEPKFTLGVKDGSDDAIVGQKERPPQLSLIEEQSSTPFTSEAHSRASKTARTNALAYETTDSSSGHEEDTPTGISSRHVYFGGRPPRQESDE